MAPFKQNQLSLALLGTSGLNPWAAHDSSSRIQMFNSHLTQTLVLSGATLRRTQTGVEREFGKYTFKIKMPADGQIIRCVMKYPPSVGVGGIKENPLTTVVYENVHTKEVGIIDLKRYHCNHQHYGFKYKYTNAQSRLSPGNYIGAGTVIADSPSVTDDGGYKYGIETNVAFMSVPAVIEDGIVASKSYLQKLRCVEVESRKVNFGKKFYPLNLYGDEKNYKPFPDIGDRIRPDGLLFALRPYDDILAVVDMTPEALRVPDSTYDKLVYATPNAIVADINVVHDKSANPPRTPEGMEEQCVRYERATTAYYQALLEEYNKLHRHRGRGLTITRQFHRRLVKAFGDSGWSDSGSAPPGPVKRTHRREPIDDWEVTVTFEGEFVPTIGSKITDCHGG